MAELKKAAEREGTSINQFIVVSVSRRLAELRAMRYLEERAARGNIEEAKKILAMAGTGVPLRDGDEIPEGWLEGDTQL